MESFSKRISHKKKGIEIIRANKGNIPGKGSKFKWIELAIGSNLKFQYYTFTGLLRWNSTTGQVQMLAKKIHANIYKISNAITMFFTSAMIYTSFQDLRAEKSTLYKFSTIFRTAGTIIFIFTALLEIHTKFRRELTVEFLNIALNYFKLQRKHRILESPKRFDQMVGLALFFLYSATTLIVLIAIGYAFYDCEGHLFSRFIPMCTGENNKEFKEWKSTLWTIFSIAILIPSLMQQMGSVMWYQTVVVLPVLGGMMVLLKMRSKKAGILDKNGMWLLHYKCLRILMTRANICLGEYIVPACLMFVVVLHILLNYALIVVQKKNFLLLIPIFIIAIVDIVLVTIMQQGFSFYDISSEILEYKKSKCDRRKTHFALQLRTCWPLSVTFGRFFQLRLITALHMLSVIVTNTVNAVIAFPV